MKIEELENLQILAESMDWDDLTYILIKTEKEFYETFRSLSEKQLLNPKNKIHKKLEIMAIEVCVYEEAKAEMVFKCSRPFGDLYCG